MRLLGGVIFENRGGHVASFVMQAHTLAYLGQQVNRYMLSEMMHRVYLAEHNYIPWRRRHLGVPKQNTMNTHLVVTFICKPQIVLTVALFIHAWPSIPVGILIYNVQHLSQPFAPSPNQQYIPQQK
jgi:hypothetical protein